MTSPVCLSCLPHPPHVLHSEHFKNSTLMGHLMQWKAAIGGGDKAHVLGPNANAHRCTLCQITGTIRCFKRISQWEGAVLKSHAPDGY